MFVVLPTSGYRRLEQHPTSDPQGSLLLARVPAPPILLGGTSLSVHTYFDVCKERVYVYFIIKTDLVVVKGHIDFL